MLPPWIMTRTAADPRTPASAAVRVMIQGGNILLDDEFEAALAPPDLPGRAALQRTWRMLALAGRMNFTAEVVDLPGQPQDIDVGVGVAGCTMQPRFFPYALDQVSGAVRYARNRVYLTDVRARHGDNVLGLKRGQVILKPGGGFQVRLEGVRGSPLTADADFLRALPPPLRKGLEAMQLRGPVDAETDLIIDSPPEPNLPPVVWWDGGAVLRDATLRAGVEVSGVTGQVCCCGLHNGQQFEGVVGNVAFDTMTLLKQPLRNVHTRLEVLPASPDVLRFRDFRADLFGGTVGGEGRVELGPVLRYDAVVKAMGIQLEQFGRHNIGAGADVKGPAQAAVHLMGEGTDVTGLKGNGRIDVPEGKLYKLPVLLDLVKAFGLRLPDRTAFEQAHLVFGIDGPQLQVHQLDLFGNAISLRGQGTLNLDGTNLNLDFNADWARMTQVLPDALNEIPRTISDQLLKVKMRGKLGDVRYETELVPGVMDPLWKVLAGNRESR
jgi:hypothetical protein